MRPTLILIVNLTLNNAGKNFHGNILNDLTEKIGVFLQARMEDYEGQEKSKMD